ncbi:hypothetical protein Nepgr_004515 [Nepenthes gracilis]|uniref:Uncharacterized protein n=1 Tax=Nepenthes gracilis TaxID=150966 RepID=A0AAD3S200_NEPGR|nr:hypothetical protein Nepgr_004515 [Nepenthes gracilis]
MDANNGGITGSIDLSPRGSDEVIDLTGHVHHLPCCVKFTGTSSVSHYFKPRNTGVEVDGLIVEEAFFRGRKLQGTTVSMPETYAGFVLGKKNPGKGKAQKILGKGEAFESEWNSNSWEMLAKCRNMTFWNHDSLPSQDDASMRSFHWFAVSKALHEPVSAEDLASAPFSQEQN